MLGQLAQTNEAPPTPVVVFPVQETVAKGVESTTKIPDAQTIQNQIVSTINALGIYSAESGSTFKDEGYVVIPRLNITGTSDFRSMLLTLTVLQMPKIISLQTKTYDVKAAVQAYSQKISTVPFVSAIELNSLLSANVTPPLIPADVVFINDGLPDSKTAQSTFSGPAYYEARLHQDLQIHRLLGIGIGQYLNSPGNTGALAIFSSNDEALNAACAKNPDIVAIRYSLDYEETKNPVWGSQNGTATIVTRLQRCGEPPTTEYPIVANAHNIGSGALLSPQYFELANWLLSSARKNPNYRGFLGTQGGIAATLLPVAPDTAAEARAVGDTARKSACLASYYYYDPLNFETLKPSQLGIHPGKDSGICDIVHDREKVVRIQERVVPSPIPSPTP